MISILYFMLYRPEYKSPGNVWPATNDMIIFFSTKNMKYTLLAKILPKRTVRSKVNHSISGELLYYIKLKIGLYI